MTRKEFKEVIKPFADKSGKDNDPYFVIHFSREQDVYTGFDNGLDFGDALMIVAGLCKRFGIEPEVIPDKEILTPIN